MGVVYGPAGKRGKGGNKPELMEKRTVDKVEMETSLELKRRWRIGGLFTRSINQILSYSISGFFSVPPLRYTAR